MPQSVPLAAAPVATTAHAGPLAPEGWQKALDKVTKGRPAEGLFVLCDRGSHRHAYRRIKGALPAGHRLIRIPEGEGAKTLETATTVIKALMAGLATRHSVLLCLGGGMVCDLGGFVASIYKRGIRVIYAPTTLLAMVDAAHGGKTGLDHEGLKNLLGTFSEPDALVLEPRFLETLQADQLRAGWAEVIKHGLLDSPEAWATLRRTDPQDPGDWPLMIGHSVEFKGQVVAADPQEQRLRQMLNLGHTLGHAIEAVLLARGKPALHGDCVAAGLALEAWIAWKLGHMNEEMLMEIEETIFSTYPPLPVSAADLPALKKALYQDKKNRGGEVRAVLLSAPGAPLLDSPLPLRLLAPALRWYTHSLN